MNKSINISLPILVAIIIIVGGVAFYGGMKYDASKKQAGFPGASLGNGQRAGFNPNSKTANGSRMGNRQGSMGDFFSGEILSKDDKSITLKLPDGGSKIVLFSTSTEITKSTSGALEDFEIGKNITITGTTNTDGSVTAKSIQLRPAQPQQIPQPQQ